MSKLAPSSSANTRHIYLYFGLSSFLFPLSSFVEWKLARIIHSRSVWPAHRTKVRAQDVQLLVVADNRPVDCDLLFEDTVESESSLFAKQPKPSAHS